MFVLFLITALSIHHFDFLDFVCSLLLPELLQFLADFELWDLGELALGADEVEVRLLNLLQHLEVLVRIYVNEDIDVLLDEQLRILPESHERLHCLHNHHYGFAPLVQDLEEELNEQADVRQRF